TVAFVLAGDIIAKPIDTYFESGCDSVSCSGSVILSVVSRPRISSSMGQVLSDAELLRNKSPVHVESFEFPNEIGEHSPIRVHKPIQLIAMRRRMDAGAAT